MCVCVCVCSFALTPQDKRNFTRDPPPGAKPFHFDYDVFSPIALATLQEDPRLQEMRFELVPKQWVLLNVCVYACVRVCVCVCVCMIVC